MSSRNLLWSACVLVLLGVVACGADDAAGNDSDGGEPGGSEGPGLIDGKTPDELKNGKQDPKSLLDRYEPSCLADGITLSGELEGTSIEERYSASFVGGLSSVQRRDHAFGEGGTSKTLLSGVSETEPFEYWRKYASDGSVLLPFDHELAPAVVCAGKGSSFYGTPIEDVFQLENAALHACPGEKVDATLDACVVFGLNDTLCAKDGLHGTLEGKPIDYSVLSAFGGGGLGVTRIEFAINYNLAYVADDAGNITKGVLTSDDGMYCVGKGSKVTRTEQDFDSKLEIELRGLSKLPSCEDSKDGDSSLRVCYRP